MITLKNIRKVYRLAEQDFEVLHGVSFEIKRGEFIALIGASGSGKTTTMNILGLLDQPTSGEYFLDNQRVDKYTSDDRAVLRNRLIGFVFQGFFLLPRLSALQNVGLPLVYRNMETAEINELALKSLEKVGMGKWAHHRPNQLSGGQQQRVAIARALIGSPKMILADEPTGALDSKTGQEVLNLLLELNQEFGATIVLVTHDRHVASQCQRIIQMVDGNVVS